MFCFNKMFVRTIIFTFCFAVVSLVEVDLNFGDGSEVEDGRSRYAELLERAAKNYGDCWKNAMKKLHVGCGKLTEEIQSRLTLSFTYCFLNYTEMADFNACDDSVSVALCLKNSSDRVFHTYTEFYTHTHSMCQFLKHREWQEETAKTVLMLNEHSHEVGKKLSIISRSQDRMQDLQQTFINDHKKLVMFSKILNSQLLQSSSNARNAFNEFKVASDQQKHLLFEVFDRLKTLQNFVLDEFSGIYTVGFYMIAMLSIYVATSIKRTADARMCLILIFFLCALFERYFASFSIEEILSLNPYKSNELKFSRIWLCRKVSCTFSIVILFIFYYRYTDYNKINNELLKEIQMQNFKILKLIQGSNGLSANEAGTLVFSLSSNHILQEKAKEMICSPDNVLNESEAALTISSSSTNLRYKKATREKENITSSLFLDTGVDQEIKNEKTRLHSKNNSAKADRKIHQGGLNSRSIPNKMLHSPSSAAIILAEIPSPGSPRYKLRSSSRLNSPVSS